MLKRRLSSF